MEQEKMLEQIKKLDLKENDIVTIVLSKDEAVRDTIKALGSIAKQIGIHFYAVVIPEGTEFKIMSRKGKIELKEMLEKSLRED